MKTRLRKADGVRLTKLNTRFRLKYISGPTDGKGQYGKLTAGIRVSKN